VKAFAVTMPPVCGLQYRRIKAQPEAPSAFDVPLMMVLHFLATGSVARLAESLPSASPIQVGQLCFAG